MTEQHWQNGIPTTNNNQTYINILTVKVDTRIPNLNVPINQYVDLPSGLEVAIFDALITVLKSDFKFVSKIKRRIKCGRKQRSLPNALRQ